MRQRCRGNNTSQKSTDSQVLIRVRRLPEDHLSTSGFLEQTQRRDRAADQTNHMPQAKQPSVALRKICDKQDYSQEQSASDHPRSADRVINGAGHRGREVA